MTLPTTPQKQLGSPNMFSHGRSSSFCSSTPPPGSAQICLEQSSFCRKRKCQRAEFAPQLPKNCQSQKNRCVLKSQHAKSQVLPQKSRKNRQEIAEKNAEKSLQRRIRIAAFLRFLKSQRFRDAKIRTTLDETPQQNKSKLPLSCDPSLETPLSLL